MRRVAVVFAYVMALFMVGTYFDDLTELGISALVAAAFSICYTTWASGSRAGAFATVAFITLVVPVVGLMFIASPVYPSWSYSFRQLVQVSVEHGYFSGLEWFVPLAGACTGIVLARYLPAGQGVAS